MPEFGLVLRVVITISNFVEVIHVELPHKRLVAVMAEVLGEDDTLELLDIFDDVRTAGLAPVDER